MSAKAIREATGKDILNRHLGDVAGAAPCKFASVTSETNWNELVKSNPWLETTVSSSNSWWCLFVSTPPLLLPLMSNISTSYLRVYVVWLYS